MRTDHAVTRSSRVANKDEQWLSIYEADCEQNHRHVWKHYLRLRSVNMNLQQFPINEPFLLQKMKWNTWPAY